MISDRRRLGAGWERELVVRAAAAARAGVHLIQIREPDLDGRVLSTVVEECVEAVRGSRARVIVNDRLDVAVTTRAHGLHLRGDSFPAARARANTPAAFVIGRSVHSVAELERADSGEGLDYVMFGTVFASPSKPGAAAAGTRALAEIVQSTALPVIAVGGMTVERLAGVAAAGAAGFAAISLFAEPSVEELALVVGRAAAAFDTPPTVP